MQMADPDYVKALYEQAKTLRAPREDDWRLASAYCLPRHYSMWQADGPPQTALTQNTTRKLARMVYDSTGLRSLNKYVAILDRIATPQNQKWHTIQAADPDLRKRRTVQEWTESVTNLLFRTRENPLSRFRTSVLKTYRSIGTYGNGPMFVGSQSDRLRSGDTPTQYVPFPLRDCFILTDDEDNIIAFFRRFWLNARMFKTKFPDEDPPPSLRPQGTPAQDESKYEEFIHVVWRKDEPARENAIDNARFQFGAVYMCVRDKKFVGRESGYREMPYVMPRIDLIAGDPYGSGPALTALPALGGASTQKKTLLKHGNRAADPVLLAHDDGVLSGPLDLRPGAVNSGALDRQGRELVKALQQGDYRVAELVYSQDRMDVEDSFFVQMFSILTEHPEMTATEVIERTVKEAALLAPTMAQMQAELLAPLILREVSVLAERGQLPPPPEELRDADMEVVYLSPMAKSMYGEEVSGFVRSVEISMNVAREMQDPSLLDVYDFDIAQREIAERMNVPVRWMRPQEEVTERREARSSQAEQSEIVQNAAGLGAAAKSVSELQESGGGRRTRNRGR